MRIYKGKIPKIAMDIISSLATSEGIEVSPENVPEAEMDIRAILDGYVRTEQEVVDEAKEIMERKGLAYNEFRRIKRMVAQERKHITGDEGLGWIINQIIEVLLHSPNVDEVYDDDLELRRKIHDVFKRNTVDEEQLDAEVRARLKNVQEGTPAWDIEYQKVMREVKRKHGLLRDKK